MIEIYISVECWMSFSIYILFYAFTACPLIYLLSVYYVPSTNADTAVEQTK